jgi:type I restriction enzyme M protein
MFEQTFKNIDDILWKEAGCQSELDYVEQTSWILFLKYLDDLEKERRTKAELAGKTYEDIIAKTIRGMFGQRQKPKMENRSSQSIDR